jgi:hypothetical protein
MERGKSGFRACPGSDRKAVDQHTRGRLSKTFGWLATAVMTAASILLAATTVAAVEAAVSPRNRRLG